MRNPAAIELIKKYDGLSKATYPEQIYWNDSEATWDLIKDRYKMDMANNVLHAALSYNSSSWAKRLADENNIPHDDPWFDRLDSKAIKNMISNVGISNLDDQDWIAICSNPRAIDILREHPDNIWEDIWANPAIFELTQRPGVLNILTELTW